MFEDSHSSLEFNTEVPQPALEVIAPSHKFKRDNDEVPTPPKRYLSPLRYPGAKSKLTPIIAEMISRARSARRLVGPVTLIEPFAGGAATSLRLLTDGVVEHAFIADGDPMVAAFWREAADHPDRLIKAMRHEYQKYLRPGGRVAVDRWDYWRNWEVLESSFTEEVQHKLAVKCLFLNRTTFSGILHGSAGPIGGRAQNPGGYAISCRYNPESLAERIAWIGHLRSSGKLLEPQYQGWQQSLELFGRSGVPARNLVAYLDPPYIEKSVKLYRRSFSSKSPDKWGDLKEHLDLASFLRTEMPYRWILSYDFHPELTTNAMLYAGKVTKPSAGARENGASRYGLIKGLVELQHSAAASKKRAAVQELIIATLAKSDLQGIAATVPN